MKKWNSGLLWLGIVWGALLIAFCLMSCRTKSVTEYVAVHDTLRVLSHDTVTKTVTKKVTKKDSTKKYHFIDVKKMMVTERDRTVTLNERGDTTRVNTDTRTWLMQSQRDSVGYYHERCDSLSELVDVYKARCDSLQTIVDKTHDKTIVKQPPWWERWGGKIGFAVVGLLLLTFILRRLVKQHISDKT